MTKQNEVSFSEAVQGLPVPVRWSLTIFLSGAIGWYVPLISVTLSGVWINNVGMWKEALSGCLFLTLMNLIGYWTRRPSVIACLFLLLIVGYEAQHLAKLTIHWTWGETWQLFYMPAAAIPLSAWTFTKFLDAADLLRKPKPS